MKHKYNCVLIIFLLSFQCSVFSQTNALNLKIFSGENKSIELNTLRKITFSAGNMVMNFLNSTSDEIAMNSIEKMFFGTFTSLSNLSDSDLLIYPNPGTDYIKIKNVSVVNQTIKVYDLNGILHFSLTISSSDSKIDVSGLNKGVYLLKVNENVLKFTKI